MKTTPSQVPVLPDIRKAPAAPYESFESVDHVGDSQSNLNVTDNKNTIAVTIDREA